MRHFSDVLLSKIVRRFLYSLFSVIGGLTFRFELFSIRNRMGEQDLRCGIWAEGSEGLRSGTWGLGCEVLRWRV